MIKQINNHKGFTLIELMIAISILSLLLFTGSYSYKLLADRWDKNLGNFSNSSIQSKNIVLLGKLLAGIPTFVITDDNKRPSFFFIGKKESLLSVSRQGIFNPKQLVIFRLTAQEMPDGKFDLIYQSVSTDKLLLTHVDQKITFENQLSLFRGLDSVSFEYLGWSHFDNKSNENGSVVPATWFETFSGLDNQLIPTRLSLTLIKDGKPLLIPAVLDHHSEQRLSAFDGMDK